MTPCTATVVKALNGKSDYCGSCYKELHYINYSWQTANMALLYQLK